MSKLERLTYICLITLSVVSAGILIKRAWLTHSAQKQMASPNTLVGKRLDVPGVIWNSSQISAVVFLSTECRYCEASMPFYRRLVSEHHQTAKNGVSLLAISLEPSESVNSHLTSEQVQFDHVYQIAQPNRLFPGTPTFLIVDKNGIIQRAAFGELPASKEDEMLQIVKTGQLDSKYGL